MRYSLGMEGYFQPGGVPLLKELAIISIDKPIPAYHLCNILFKAPYPFKLLNNKYREKNNWLIKNHHAL